MPGQGRLLPAGHESAAAVSVCRQVTAGLDLHAPEMVCRRLVAVRTSPGGRWGGPSSLAYAAAGAHPRRLGTVIAGSPAEPLVYRPDLSATLPLPLSGGIAGPVHDAGPPRPDWGPRGRSRPLRRTEQSTWSVLLVGRSARRRALHTQSPRQARAPTAVGPESRMSLVGRLHARLVRAAAPPARRPRPRCAVVEGRLHR